MKYSLIDSFSKVEDVFFYETDSVEEISRDLLASNIDVSNFLTIIDVSMQRQAYLTEEIWMDISAISNQNKKQGVTILIDSLWDTNYESSLKNMKNALLIFEKDPETFKIKENVVDIVLDICRSRIDAAKLIGKQTRIVEEEYMDGRKLIKQGEYESGFDSIQKAFTQSNMLIEGQTLKDVKSLEKEDKKISTVLFFMILIIVIVIVVLLHIFSSRFRKSNQKH